MTPILLQSEFRIKSYDHFIPDRSMLKSDPVERQFGTGIGTDGSVAHPVERQLERALERTSLERLCCSPGRTAIGTGIGTDGSVSHPVERKTPRSNGKLQK
jgi:hypothetical protein